MSLIRSAQIFRRVTPLTATYLSRAPLRNNSGSSHEVVTHTGQQFEVDDYRRMRFEEKGKLVNQKFAVQLVDEDPVVVCEQRRVFSDGGGALGHPRVYINLDQAEIGVCGYSGRKFIMKKYYNEKEHGPSITYEEYLKEMNPQHNQWPN